MKVIPAITTEDLQNQVGRKKPAGRGYNVFHASELMNVSAQTKQGERLNVSYEQDLFTLSIDDRIRIFEKCADVFGVISGRMNRISALDWGVVSCSKQEDRIYQQLKDWYSLLNEYKEYKEPKYFIASSMIGQKIRSHLPECLPDLSNFGKCLIRWKRNLKNDKTDKCTEIEDFLSSPNSDDGWEDFIKQWVFDLLVHGSCGIYKEYNENLNILDNIYVLNGGTIMPIRGRFVGGATAYLQMAIDIEPAIYFKDEVSFSRYLPSSDFVHGKVPLEALVNKVAESLLFDELMAEQADGTKPPEKVVVFGDNSAFGSLGDDFGTDFMDTEEQKRVEQAINEKRKQAIRTLSGIGQPMVLDLSKQESFSMQNERQKLIRETVGLVYGVSNMELNMSSSDGVSGRSTSEALETIDQNKSVLPIVRTIERIINREILPFRFGAGYNLEFQISVDPKEELAYYKDMVDSGLYSVNEVRSNEIGVDPFDGEEFDKPKGTQPEQPDPMAMMGGMM